MIDPIVNNFHFPDVQNENKQKKNKRLALAPEGTTKPQDKVSLPPSILPSCCQKLKAVAKVWQFLHLLDNFVLKLNV